MLTVRAATSSITSVSPATITAGSGDATLTVTGTNFAVGSVALWNSQPRPTSFVSTTVLEFVVGAGLSARKIVVLAGSPRSVVVARETTCCSSDGGAAVYDDGVPRPKAASGVAIILRGPTPGRLYGYNNWTTGHEFSSVVVTPEGLVVETSKDGLVTGFHQFDFAYDGGFVLTSSRAVIAVPAMLRVGTIPGDEAPVRPDAAKGRVHFFFGPTLSTFHYTSFASIGTFTNAAIDGHTRFDRWGSDGIVVGGGQSIVFVRGSVIGP